MTSRILVVDDEPDLETLITQKFRRQIRVGAMNFVFAHDGVEALAMVKADPAIELVVSDINMPRMDGLTLIEELRAMDHLSTIIVSAYGDMANIRTAMNRGAFDFLTKPIDFSDLETTIAKTLRHLATLNEARRRQAQAERAHASLARYFSPRLAERLAESGDVSELAGERREVATLFTDVAGFTSLAESMEPALLARLINEYLTGMTEIVFAHDGTVAKIIGDALHVLFGAPSDQPDHARRAIACAIDLDAFSQGFREQWKSDGVAVGVTRIGVHAGPAVVGNFGGGHYFDYTAYGDTINTAARLEKANKDLGTRICVSAAVVERAGTFVGRPVGDLMLRGRTDPLAAFEPLAPGVTSEAYLAAFALLRNADSAALGAFAAEVGKRPDDGLASFHLKRLLNGSTGTLIVVG